MLRTPASALLTLLVVTAGCGPSQDIDAAAAALEARYGVRVVYTVDSDFFPAAWHDPPISARATRLPARDVDRLLRLLPAWLDEYPPQVLHRYLDSIRLSRSLELEGLPGSGTWTARDVYIATSGRRGVELARVAERTLHHELSSVLIYGNGDFPLQAWYDARPAGFSYLSDIEEINELIAGDRGIERSEELHRLGAIEAYALTGWENDVNSYAEEIFVQPEEMRRLIDTYPAIRTKFEILKRFYLELSPEFAPIFARIEG